ncbi:MAG: 3-alpha-hydroxysteroid dehydrogenase [Gammaproteobacteria bacterium]|nr:MAG: 3-alpha-hydroxysteroid dehydrogenase [Gammaproteobacteria bacterium]RLA52988.1 MAG: 3-alpha-hydroxysteroid dehydrogenase [Gammaproteobacteria bacterium]
MGTLDGKVAIITGSARGQGAAEARLFAERGAKVMLTDVLDDEGAKTAASIGASAAYMNLDVTNEDSWSKVIAATVEKFGKVNVLVNNAGIITPAIETHETTLESYTKVINVNQVGVFLGMKAVVNSMKDAGGGSIINIASIDGLTGMYGASAYCASKFAVRGMTKVAALELGKYGIRVNSLHPGGVQTKILADINLTADEAAEAFKAIPLGRIGLPEEMATLAAYLASDDSSYSTGSEFIADGGMTAGFSLDG